MPSLEAESYFNWATSKTIESRTPFMLIVDRVYTKSRRSPVLFVLSGMQIQLPDIVLGITLGHRFASVV